MKTQMLATLAVIGLFAAVTNPAHAACVSANASVTINYVGACTLSAASPTFDYLGADTSSHADLTVNCSSGLAWTLTADGGANVSGEVRNAKKATDFFTYRLFKDAGLTQEIGVTTNTVGTGTGTGIDQIVTPYYALKLTDNSGSPAAGNYTDTIAYSLAF